MKKDKLLTYLGGSNFGNEFHFRYPDGDVTFIIDITFNKTKEYDDEGYDSWDDHKKCVIVSVDPSEKHSDCNVVGCQNHDQIGDRCVRLRDYSYLTHDGFIYITCGYLSKDDRNFKKLREELNELVSKIRDGNSF